VYNDRYNPTIDPFAGSAHCEHVANQLSEVFGCSCTYSPSDDGHLISFRLTDCEGDGGIATIVAIPDRTRKLWNLQ
jgi:hypothetical protein